MAKNEESDKIVEIIDEFYPIEKKSKCKNPLTMSFKEQINFGRVSETTD